MTAPVLRRELLTAPVRIESIELIKAGDQFLVRARSTDGAIGMAVGHPDVLERPGRFWPGRSRRSSSKKDARDLEALLDELYIASSNYKWQGLPFWVPVASVEIALLDLLGQVARKPIGELFGPIVRRDIAVYRASGNRGNIAEAEIDYLRKLVGEIGAQGHQVPARRADALRRCLDAARPGADPADAQDVRRGDGDPRRCEQLVRRPHGAANRPVDARAAALRFSKSPCRSTSTTKPGKSPTR